MRILVTNDDGIDAPGLAALVGRLVAAGHDVAVAAPSSERSGSGTSLGGVYDGTPSIRYGPCPARGPVGTGRRR